MDAWDYLAIVLIGCILYEFSSRIVTILESGGDYSSPFYLLMIVLATLGLILGIVALKELYFRAKKQIGDSS